MSKNYYFDEDNRFTIENYSGNKPFASFLPGIAGLNGIPMWAFYVNRGQAICAFGIKDKNHPIMEFFPAYKCFQTVDYMGFRTFIKTYKEEGFEYYEPFSSVNSFTKGENKMFIGANECEIEELSKDGALKTNVCYFTLPQEGIAALVRKVTITNTSDEIIKLEVLDGMPAVMPYGTSNGGLKEVGHTLKAWMSVYNVENRIPFYKLRASAGDTAEVSSVEEGHFYLCFMKEEGKEVLLPPIVDAEVIFGSNTSLSYPMNFIDRSLEELYEYKQMTANKVPTGFFGAEKTIKPGESVEMCSFIGHATSLELVDNLKSKLLSFEYVDEKYKEAKALVREITEDIDTKTSSKVFDEYCRQTYLDNVLRGGYPLLINDDKVPMVYHVYSRKHGDLERDYNFFLTEPEFYSSGNGNYRDVNQNRRSDVLFHPEVKDFNVHTFMNLIQVDGYNPLVINGYVFRLKDGSAKEFMKFVQEEHQDKMESMVRDSFTMGKLLKFLINSKITLKVSVEEMLQSILRECEQVMEAVHGEGYWTDHWTYNLDLIESYLSIYPDKKKEVLLKRADYTYFDNDAIVLPREKKYVLSKGKVRQYEATEHCPKKIKLIESRNIDKNVMREEYGMGKIYTSNLHSKLIILALNKFSLLDPMGMGIEMEGGKPGWDDALNGLPGIFGSSMAESYELQRLLNFILELQGEYKEEISKIPVEIVDFMNRILASIDKFNKSIAENKNYIYWDEVSTIREQYRENSKFGFSGEEEEFTLGELSIVMNQLSSMLSEGIEKAYKENNNMYPTFFYYEVTEHELLRDEEGRNKVNKKKLPLVKAKKFEQKNMPLFLEGTVRALKIQKGIEASRKVYEDLKTSALFDEKLKMYKLNESLEEESIEIGRVRAFTRGWLENETIWLHMEYKYILEVLSNGLYKEFFSDFKNVIVPFFDAHIYGRSPLENSSFIASSANPDESVHGTGFVARLSGATAEFLSIWNVMMIGHKPFFIKEDMLCLELKPILPAWLFDENNKISFNFLGRTKVTYLNSAKKDTYESEVKTSKIALYYADGNKVSIDGSVILEPYSEQVRCGKITRIEVKLE